MSLRLRLLPLCILIAFAMLSLKSYDLGRGLTVLPSDMTISQVRAQTQPLLFPVAGGASTSAAPLPGDAAVVQVAEVKSAAAATPGPQAAAPANGKPGDAKGAAPGTRVATAIPKESEFLANQDELTREELSILQRLRDRRLELEQQEKDLAARDALLKATEKRIEDKVKELQSLQAAIQNLVSVHDEQEKRRLDSLVKVYENMKPAKAAAIFGELDILVMLDVIELMKERKVAPILAAMDPNKAKEVTVELANRRKLPVPKQ